MTRIERAALLITDEDARPLGGAHPYAHLWDNGRIAADELNRMMKVRAAALKRFGENAIRDRHADGAARRRAGAALPVASLPDGSGGKGNWRTGLPLRRARRRADDADDCSRRPSRSKALAAVLETLAPETLTLPESLLKIASAAAAGLSANAGKLCRRTPG